MSEGFDREDREEWEEEERRKTLHRRHEREKRRRRVRRMRILLCAGILAVCAGTGVLAAGIFGKARQGNGNDADLTENAGRTEGASQAGDADAAAGAGQAGSADPAARVDQPEGAGQTADGGQAAGAGRAGDAAQSAGGQTENGTQAVAGQGNSGTGAGRGKEPLPIMDWIAPHQRAEIGWHREDLPEFEAIYDICVSGRGWSSSFADNSFGMAPEGSFVTAIRVRLQAFSEIQAELTGTVEYQVNLSGHGWQDWVADYQETGDSSGEGRLEAVRMRLSGDLADYYDIMYSVLQENGWTDWVKNGEDAGRSGEGLHLSGLRVSMAKKSVNGESYAGNIDPHRPMVALTYDDGPSKSVTPRILAKLKEYGGRATFFMVGVQVERNLDLIPQIVAAGCEVANHTYDHTLMTKVDPAVLEDQLIRTNQAVASACGVTPVLMRPCGGATNESGMMAAGAISMPAILWSIDTLDWKTKDSQNTIRTVLENVKDGDIVLMHDLYSATADASEVLIPELINRGFQLVTVSELASYRGGMVPGKTYGRFRP